MPDRNPKLGRLLVMLMLIIIALSAIGTTSTVIAISFAQSSDKNAKSAKESSDLAKEAVVALKVNSARTECRTQLINDDDRLNNRDTHEFQKEIIDILLTNRDDPLKAIAIAKAADTRVTLALKRQTAQEAIDAQCPPAIVKSPDYTIPKNLGG